MSLYSFAFNDSHARSPMSSHPFPSPEEGFALHRRILDEELVAPNEFSECYLGPLSDWLAARSPSVHPDDCCTAAIDALTDYFGHPEKYDPAKLELGAYLRMAARRDLSNLGRSEAKHQRRRNPDFRVEEDDFGGNSLRDDPLTSSIRREEQEATRERLDAVGAECTGSERAFLALMREGERNTGRFALALEVEHLPEAEQQRVVKRARDRFVKRIHRKGEGER